MLEQRQQNCKVTHLRSKDQRRGANIGLLIDCCTVVEQRLHHIVVTIPSRKVERRPTIEEVLLIDFRTTIEQRLQAAGLEVVAPASEGAG